MSLIISIVILVLLGLIFYREIKSEKEVDLFINIVISLICIGTALFTYFTDGFNLEYLEHIIYLIVIVVACIFTVYYLVKYFKNKKEA